jgi:hypothetical protein
MTTISDDDASAILERAARESLRARVVEAILHMQLVYSTEPNFTGRDAEIREEVCKALDRLLDRVTDLEMQ